MNPSDITDSMVEQVESAVGMGSNAWDTVDPKEIIAAAISLTEVKKQSLVETPYLIASFNELIYRTLLRSHGLTLDDARRIRTENDVRGLRRDRPLYCLPDWHLNRDTKAAVHLWEAYGGKCVSVSEQAVQGGAPFPPLTEPLK